MENITINSGGKLLERFFYSALKCLLSVIVGFIIAKANVRDLFSPFALSVLAVTPFTFLSPPLVYLGSSIGFITNSFSVNNLKYIIALTVLLAVIVICGKTYKKRGVFSPALPGAICFICGFLFLFISNFSIFSLALIACESILSGCAAFFLHYIICAFNKKNRFGQKDIIAFSITLVIALIAVDSINISGFSLMRIFGIFIIYICAYYFKGFYSAIAGICIGALAAALHPELVNIFVAFVLAALLCGAFSIYSFKYSAIAFFTTYAGVMLFGNLFFYQATLLLEPLIVLAIFMLLPKKKITSFLEKYFTPQVPVYQEKEDFKYSDNHTVSKLCKEYTELTKQLSDIIGQDTGKQSFYPAAENGIKKHLFLKGYSCLSVICAEDYCERAVIDISFKSNNKPVSKKELLRITGHYINKNLSIGLFELKNGTCNTKLLQADNYKVDCAAVYKAKSGERVCGDNVTAFKTKKARYVLMLSDGMGSGKSAYSQSSLCVALMKKLLRANVQPYAAAAMVNSTLFLRNSENSFSTLDACVINLKTSKAVFVKAGSYASYILRGEEVITIKSAGMPLGILEKPDIKTTDIKLEKSDYIIIVSDGAAYDNIALEQTIKEEKSENLELFSKRIMDFAVQNTPEQFDDDMTVLIARLYKNE